MTKNCKEKQDNMTVKRNVQIKSQSFRILGHGLPLPMATPPELRGSGNLPLRKGKEGGSWERGHALERGNRLHTWVSASPMASTQQHEVRAWLPFREGQEGGQQGWPAEAHSLGLRPPTAHRTPSGTFQCCVLTTQERAERSLLSESHPDVGQV